MIIRIPLLFQGSKGEKQLYALFDSGANCSCITQELAELIAKPDQILTPFHLTTAKDGVRADVAQSVRLDFYYDDFRFRDEFFIIKELSEDVIIGADSMDRWGLQLDFNGNKVVVDPRAARPILINLMQPSSLRKKTTI